MRKKQKLNEQGITLTVLVVTIIILLILAGVAISVLNEAGILTNSQSAADKYEITDEQDVISVAFSTVFANSALNDSDITPNILQKELDKTTRETTVRKSNDAGKENLLYIKFDKTKNEHSVDITNGKIDYIGPYSEITVDIIKNAVISMSAEPTAFTKGNVTVTITYTLPEDKKGEKDKIVLEYALSGAPTTWNQYQQALTIEENMTVYARLRYLTETTEVPASLAITNIDKLPPLAFTPTISATTNSITVSATTVDAPANRANACSGLAGYSFSKDGGKTWTTYQTSGTYIFDQLTQNTIYPIQVKVKDKADNETIATQNVNTMKVTGLTIVASNADKWTTSKTITITANNANYQTIRYTTNGSIPTSTNGTTIINGGTFTISNNCQIYAIAFDSTTQTGPTASCKIDKIDIIEPTLAINSNGGNAYTMPTNGNAIIKTKVTVSDTGGSGVYTAGLQYTWAQTTTAPSSGWIGFTNGTTIEKNNITQVGTWYLWIKYNDNARNNSGIAPKIEKSNAFIIGANTDNKNKIILTANTTNWTNQDVTVSVTYGTNLTQSRTLGCNGINGTDYTVNETTNVIVKTNGKTVTATAKDAMGNMITASLTVTNIDKVAPSKTTVNLNGYTSGSWTTGNITQTFSATDSGSGVAKYQYSHDGTNAVSDVSNPWVINSDREWTMYIRAIDVAGNAGPWSDRYLVKRHTHVTSCYHSHSGSSSSGGGCYGGRNYHSHSGNSISGGGCYGGRNYHSHVGNTTSGGTCYGKKHSHTDACYTFVKVCGVVMREGCKCNSDCASCEGGSHSHNHCGTGIRTCPTCGATRTYVKGDDTCKAKTYGSLKCSKKYVLSCTKTTSTVDSYYINCGKTTSTVVSYYRNCNLSDRQLICTKR